MNTSSHHISLLESSMLTPLGLGTELNFETLLRGQSGIQLCHDARFFKDELPLGKINDDVIEQAQSRFNTSTRFDAMLLACLEDLKEKSSIDLSSKDVIIFFSSTKGNIELLEKNEHETALYLSSSANLVQQFLKNPNQPIISNACISGLSAIIMAKRLLQGGQYKHAVVVGGDALSNFVISGFNSFHALSKERCKPFDINRSGISLGEACVAVIISADSQGAIEVQGGFISNDANHISGPSKTGEELSYCIVQSLKDASLLPEEIDFISAHGTATSYNDEMESKAFELASLSKNPVFSLKAHYGHTLGAAGILEALISAECLKRNLILPSLGFEEMGVTGNILVNKNLQSKELNHCVKTASGFGGCNASLILSKNKNK